MKREPRDCCRRPAVLPQHDVEVQAGELDCGSEADGDAKRGRETDRKEHDRGVEPDLVAARELVEPYPGQSGKRPTREYQPECATDHSEQSRLCEQLPKDPRAAGADRVPRRDLLEAPAGADESEIRDVHRGDQEHEQRRAPQQAQSRPHVAHQVGFERDDDRAIAGVEQRRFQAAGALEVRRRQRVDLRLRLLQRGA